MPYHQRLSQKQVLPDLNHHNLDGAFVSTSLEFDTAETGLHFVGDPGKE